MIVRRRITLVIWLLLLALLYGWFVATLKINSDLGAFLPQEESFHNRLLMKAIKSSPTTSILILSFQGDSTEKLARVSKIMARSLRRNPDILQVINGQLKYRREHKAFLLRYHWMLNPGLTANTFSVKNMREALEEILHQLRSPVPLIDKSIILSDPVNSVAAVLKRWSGQAGRPGKAHGVWFSRDLKQALVFLQTRPGAFEIAKQEKLLADIRAGFAKLKKKNPALSMTMTGPGFYAIKYRNLIRKDILYLTVLACIGVCTLLVMVYRGLVPLAFSFLPLLSAIAAGIAVVLLVFGNIHGITLAFGVTLIGVTIDYPIHFFTHLKKSEFASNAIREVWPTLRLGIVTTIIGFTAMLLAGFEGLKQLAVFSISGLIIAALVTRYLLPQIIPMSFRFRPSKRLVKGAEHIVDAASRLPLVIAVLTLGALVYMINHSQITDHDLKSLAPKGDDHRETDKRLRSMVGTSDTRFLLTIYSESREEVLQRSEKLETELKKLVDRGTVKGFDFAARYLPSIRTQKQRQAVIPPADTVEKNFVQASHGLGFRVESFKPFFTSIRNVRQVKPLEYEDMMNTPLNLHIQNLLHKHEKGWLALIPFRKVVDKPALIEWAKTEHVPGMRLLDLRRSTSSAVAGYVNEATSWLALGALLIFAILWWGLRSLMHMLKVVAPIAAALILTSAVWLLSGVPLNVFHLVSLLLVVGIGMDYVLFFTRKTNAEDHQLDYLAILVCNITTVIVFGLLFFAFPPVLKAIGGTVAIGALIAFIASAAVAERNRDAKAGAAKPSE